MEKTLTNTKKWSLIAEHFPGRNQHHIKNRFISVLNKELKFTRERIRSLLNENQIWPSIYKVYEGLKAKKIGNELQGFNKTENVLIETEMNRNVFNFLDQSAESSGFIELYSEVDLVSETFQIDQLIDLL